MKKTVVILAAGAALTVAGCKGRPEPTVNPPVPDTTAPPPDTIEPEVLNPEVPIRTANPPRPDLPGDGPLPTWDSVTSNHPAGATNPPLPVLAITADGSACYKEWYDPRMVPEEARALGGRVLDEGETSSGTQVQCDQQRVDALLSR